MKNERGVSLALSELMFILNFDTQNAQSEYFLRLLDAKNQISFILT